MQEKEIWKDVVGTNGMYEISSYGNVLSNHSNKILSPIFKDTGYYAVTIFYNKKGIQRLIHRLVCSHFVNPIIGKTFVNHIDGDKLNNYYKNLEWCTNSENWEHAHRIGLIDSSKLPRLCGVDSPVSRMVAQIDLNNNLVNKYNTITDASKSTGVNGSEITRVCSDKYPDRITAGGFKWKYI